MALSAMHSTKYYKLEEMRTDTEYQRGEEQRDRCQRDRCLLTKWGVGGGVRGSEWVAVELNGALTAPNAVLLLFIPNKLVCLLQNRC